MAVNIQIYSNGNNSTRTVTVDFAGDVLAESYGVSNSSSIQYFFKLQTSGRDSASVALPVKVVKTLTDLALNKNVQSATNSAAAYASVKAMIVDYTYDFIHGHIANKYSSGCTLQRPMKFS